MKTFILAAALAGALTGGAAAADMPTKALPAPIVVVSPYAWLNGLFIGMGVSGSGTNFDVLGNGVNGSINANGTIMDVHASYKYYDGTRYAAVTAGCGVSMAMNASAAGGIPSDNLMCMELIDAGGFLGNVIDISNSILPDAFKGAIPFATMGAAQRMSKTGRVGGVGAIMPIANSSWVMGARYLNIDYSNAQVSPIDTMKTENYVGFFVERKFGPGTTGLKFLGF